MKKLIYGFLALSATAFAACSSDNDEPKAPVTPEDEQAQEAPKWEESITLEFPNESRYASLTHPDENYLTATRVDLELNNYALVCYHGRYEIDKETGVKKYRQIGMVQVVDSKGKPVDEIYFPDCRVNYCTNRTLNNMHTVYIGVDRDGKKGPEAGIIALRIVNEGPDKGKFARTTLTDENGNTSTTIQVYPYDVEGVSVNCIKLWEQNKNSALIVASGGNNALGNDRKAGFTKFQIDQTTPEKLTARTEAGESNTDINLRGYWVSNNTANDLPVAYTYRKTEGNDLVYMLAVKKSKDDFFKFDNQFGDPDNEIEVMRRYGSETDAEAIEDFGRYSVSMLYYKGERYLLVCTGSKILDESVGVGGGVSVYHYDPDDATLTLVDRWNKAVFNTTNINKKDSEYPECVYASAGAQGVFKCTLHTYMKGDVQHLQLVPIKKRVTTVLTEQGTPASTNYVQCNETMECVHVAAGYEGYVKLPLSGDMWKDADKRTDLEYGE